MPPLWILDKVIVTMDEHKGAEIAHDGVGLDMQVAHHCVGLPTSPELDDVGVYMCTEDGHVSARMQGPG
jgi:hypothetical protein